MDESKFLHLSNKLINDITDNIISLDKQGIVDVDFDGEVLHIKINDQEFVINAHRAARQIWLVSPITGPHHFNYIDGKWLDRSNQEFLILLNNQLSQLTKISFLIL